MNDTAVAHMPFRKVEMRSLVSVIHARSIALPIRGDKRVSGKGLTRIIHDGSLRNCGVVLRDGQAQPQGTEAYLKQYGEGLSGEHARQQACRSSESAIAAEAFMK